MTNRGNFKKAKCNNFVTLQEEVTNEQSIKLINISDSVKH